MKYIEVDGLRMSVFSLGTVQLGMTYGLSAHNEKPSKENAFALLDRAMELGVDNLDTANNYGDSEQVIGDWMHSRPGQPKPLVVTKIGPLDHSSPTALEADIRRQVAKCQENLGMRPLDVLMIHDYADYIADPDTVRRVLLQLKEKGECRYTAISAYSRHDYGVIAETGFDAVQIPLNVFDWTQIDNGGIQKLVDAGMMIFVRSAFLQGLVFRKPEDLDPRMDFCKPYLETYHQLCQEFQLSPGALALSFPLSIPGITTVVLGCRNITQVEKNCALIDQVVQLTDEQMKKLHEAFANTDPRVTNPGVWFNHT